MPLAYPSTLDRRPPVAHFAWSPSYVEELWSPSLNAVSEKLHAKADANSKRAFQRTTLRVFLSQAGPRFDLELVQAEHHLWFRRWSGAFGHEKGDPVGRPRLACYAAKDLARTPRSEG